ncbi:MAG: cell division protein ZapA [Cyclobacteriaceae bacterium]|nr:cell division protein ZapA [Cyclobacteriaceae bacterium]
MNKLSIKIKIADREYPMKVEPEEEERIRKAGKIVNEKIKLFKSQFGIDDKQDLLAMVAFDALVERLKTEGSSNEDSLLQEKLAGLNNLISQSI